jgi:succinate dehydrogenase / fumarate reductase, cytochrome b subunit
MNRIKLIFHSSLGKKFLMAVTGVGLFGYVVGHLIGNLQVFLAPEAINRYAYYLHSAPGLLWTARLGLLAMLGLHVLAAVWLWRENRAARPVVYALDPAVGSSSYASRTMLMSGLIVAAFVVYHLLHFTVRIEGVNGTPVVFNDLRVPVTGHMDVYAMIIAGFSVWYVSLFYLAAVGLLCLHLSHGINAMFQSMGLMHRANRRGIDQAAKAVAVLLFVGYASIPVSVWIFGHGQDYLREVHLGGPPAVVSAMSEEGK